LTGVNVFLVLPLPLLPYLAFTFLMDRLSSLLVTLRCGPAKATARLESLVVGISFSEFDI